MCNHVGKVVKWGVDEDTNLVPALWGCTLCDEVSTSKLISSDDESYHSHTKYVEGCFACKIQTLQLATGDASGSLVANGWTNKKWEGELQLYRDARRQGIQPSGTSTAKIRRAMDISDKAGKAWDASSKDFNG